MNTYSFKPTDVLTFWTSDLSENDKAAVQERLDAFEKVAGIKVNWPPIPGQYYQELAVALMTGDLPDLTALPLPVPEDIAKAFGETKPWLLCNSRLAIAKESKHPAEAAQLMQYLTSAPICYQGLPITQVPYATPPPPPKEIIGDAEYVPGNEVIVEGVQALKEQLINVDATINVARSVVLTDKSTGETTYMAPVGPPLKQGAFPITEDEVEKYGEQLRNQAMEDGITFAMIVVPEGVVDLALDKGAYLVRDFLEVRDRSEQWIVRFINASGESVGKRVNVKQNEPSFDTTILAGLPSAGLRAGSITQQSCKYVWTLFRGWVYVCQTF